MARLPLDRYRVSPRGGYAYERDDGPHYAVDMVPLDPREPVKMPEAGRVLRLAHDNVTKPLTGYGPKAVHFRGRSGLFWVLGHLGSLPAHLSPGDELPEGYPLGPVAPAYNHVHVELRKTELPPTGRARGPHTLNPVAWVKRRQLIDGVIIGGVVVGTVILIGGL